jgi:hypothetical protein
MFLLNTVEIQVLISRFYQLDQIRKLYMSDLLISGFYQLDLIGDFYQLYQIR